MKANNILKRDHKIRCYIKISGWILLCSLCLLIYQIVIKNGFCNPLINSNRNCIILWEEFLVFCFANSLLIYILTKYLIQHKNGTFYNWAKVFFETYEKNEEYKLALLVFAIYIPPILYFFTSMLSAAYLPFEEELDFFKNKIWSIWGVWLTALSLVVAAKIYFEVQRSKTITLKDYLKHAIDVLEKANPNDEIIFIAPTLYVGTLEDETKNEALIFQNLLLQKIDHNIRIAILDIGTLEELEQETNTDCERKFTSLTKYPYFEYHTHFIEQAKNDNDVTNNPPADWYKKHLAFVQKIKQKITSLKSDTGCLYEFKNAIKNGFFCVANYTTGYCYMGQYDVSDVSLVYFSGSWFEDKNVMKTLKEMLNKLIEDNLVPESESESKSKNK